LKTCTVVCCSRLRFCEHDVRLQLRPASRSPSNQRGIIFYRFRARRPTPSSCNFPQKASRSSRLDGLSRKSFSTYSMEPLHLVQWSALVVREVWYDHALFPHILTNYTLQYTELSVCCCSSRSLRGRYFRYSPTHTSLA
jgi:hypothetical protein